MNSSKVVNQLTLAHYLATIHGAGLVCLLPPWEKNICMVQRILFYSIITAMWSTPRIGLWTDPLPSVHSRPTWTHWRYGSSFSSVRGRHTDLQILCSWWSFCSSAAHLNLCRPNIGMDEMCTKPRDFHWLWRPTSQRLSWAASLLYVGFTASGSQSAKLYYFH